MSLTIATSFASQNAESPVLLMLHYQDEATYSERDPSDNNASTVVRLTSHGAAGIDQKQSDQCSAPGKAVRGGQ